LVYTGVSGCHIVDNEVENAFLWSVDLESLPVHVVDLVLPVHDATVAVIVCRCIAPNNAIVQHGLTLKCDSIALLDIFLFTCDAM